MADDLSHVLAKLDWVESQLPVINGKWNTFLETKPYTMWAEPDEESGGKVVKMRYDQPFPDDIAIDNGNVFYQIRSALDQLVCALAVRNGATDTKGTSFPICADRDAFFDKGKASGRKKITKLSIGDQDWIEKLQPYNTGDDRLVSLNALGVIDKHNRPLRPNVFLGGVGVYTSTGNGFRLGDVSWGALNDETILIRIFPETYVEFEPTLGVGFKEIGNDDREPFTDTMRNAATAARDCVKIFS